MNLGQPLISFTFDDFPRSALFTAGRILEQFGLAGTYFVSMGLMGTTAPTGEIFHAEDLKHLLDNKHEIGCHTYQHCHAWKTAPKAFEASIRENSKALQKLLPKVEIRTLSYPIANPRPETKRRAGRYFSGCRAGGQTYNLGQIDLNLLSAFFLEQSRDQPALVYRMIDATCAAGGWLIFATHDVCEAPTAYGCTPSFFESIVRHAVHSGAKVLPVAEALKVINDRDV